MTNEDMAAAIKQGRTEMIPILWERIRRLVIQLAYRYYTRHDTSCKRAGVTEDDLMQEAYFGFVKAIEGYSPANGSKFVSYLSYPILGCFTEVIGQRTSRSRKEPLSHAASLDSPLQDADDLTLCDMVEDASVPEAFERIELTELQRVVREEIALLKDDRQRHAIAAHYLHEQTYQDIAKQYGITSERVRVIIHNGFRKLRASGRLRVLYEEFRGHSLDLALNRILYSPEYFELIRQIQKRQKREYLSYSKQQAILYAFMQKTEAKLP